MPTSSKSVAYVANLEKRCEELENALCEALPYVEFAEHDESYKPGAVAKMVARIRKVLDAA